MTTKRTRFDRRKSRVVAPGRAPDEVDALTLAHRDNTTTLAPTRNCRRCGKLLETRYFARAERTKQRPMCMACVANPIRRAPEWVIQAVANLPAQLKREDPHVAYDRILEQREDEEAFEAFMAYVEQEDQKFEAERSAFLERLDLEEIGC